MEPLEERIGLLKAAVDHMQTCDKHGEEPAALEVTKAELNFWEQVMLYPQFKELYERKCQAQMDACTKSKEDRVREKREKQWQQWLSNEGAVPWSDASSGSPPSSSSS
jgi:hypothetical protein